MSQKSWKDSSFLILAVVCLAASLLCGLFYDQAKTLRCILFLTAALLPLGLGSVWIFRNFWWRPVFWGILLEAILIGLVAYALALLGILLSPRGQTISWTQKMTEASPVGGLAFLAILLFGPLLMRIIRLFRH